jgi:hypothetical protein
MPWSTGPTTTQRQRELSDAWTDGVQIKSVRWSVSSHIFTLTIALLSEPSIQDQEFPKKPKNNPHLVMLRQENGRRIATQAVSLHHLSAGRLGRGGTVVLNNSAVRKYGSTLSISELRTTAESKYWIVSQWGTYTYVILHTRAVFAL